jgi:hypothetical protein
MTISPLDSIRKRLAQEIMPYEVDIGEKKTNVAQLHELSRSKTNIIPLSRVGLLQRGTAQWIVNSRYYRKIIL